MENHTTFPSLQQTPSFPYETEKPQGSSLRHRNVDQVQKTESDHSF